MCSRAGTHREPGQQDTDGIIGQVEWQVQVLEQQSWGKERAAARWRCEEWHRYGVEQDGSCSWRTDNGHLGEGPV